MMYIRWPMLVVAALSIVPAHASMITIGLDLHVNSKFDYANARYDPAFVPFSGHGTISFDNFVTSVVTDGQTTITIFGGYGGTQWVSPVTPLVGPDPYGGGVAAAMSYTFPNVSDYASTFLEEAASQGNTYSLSPDGTKCWAYHIEVRATVRSPSRGGTGGADYAFMPDTLSTFYRDFAIQGGQAYFNESYELYDYVTKSSFGGYSWGGYGTIEFVDTVPEPSSILLLIAPILGGCVWLRFRSRPT